MRQGRYGPLRQQGRRRLRMFDSVPPGTVAQSAEDANRQLESAAAKRLRRQSKRIQSK